MHTRMVSGWRVNRVVFAALLSVGLVAARTAAAVELTAANAEVVVASNASPTVVFAAKELSEFLGKALGGDVPTVSAPTAGRASVVLGSNDWSRAAGIDTAKLARDAFVIGGAGGRVFIAGRDDLAKSPFAGRHERATLFGVYEFLHRFAGVRFYFPGDLGTVVPRANAIAVPDGLATVAPSYLIRRYGPKDGIVPAEVLETAGIKDEERFKVLNKLRLRMGTLHIPCCHGQLRSKFYRRFHETHPEYFIMGADGKRHPTEAKEKPLFNKEHMCHSSAIWEEIYQDAKAYLTHQPPSVRKIPNDAGTGFISGPGVDGIYYDIMPHDGMGTCHCELCKARCDKSRKQYATDLIWSNTVAVATRLKAEGVPGYVVQMAYHPYADVPDYDIPDNVLVMVARQGPWGAVPGPDGKDPDDLVRAWAKKLGHKVWLWTYPDKIFDRTCPGIPQMSPHAWGNYFQRLKDSIIGGFGESESDRWLFNHLNYYVFSRVCWDVETDLEAVLDEYHRLMFGAGAGAMKRFYDSLERKWVKEMMSKSFLGKFGPQTVLPNYYEMWNEVYTPDTIAEYDRLLTDAAAAVPSGSLEARRIALMRREMFEPLAQAADLARERFDPARALKRRSSFRGGAVAFEDSASVEGWSAAPKNVRISRGTRPGPVTSAPLVIEAPADNAAVVGHAVAFKPSTCYRVSYFIRLDVEATERRGGVFLYAKCRGKKLKLTDAPVDGKRDSMKLNGRTGWVFVENYFTTPEKADSGEGTISFRYVDAKGRAELDGLRVEEVR